MNLHVGRPRIAFSTALLALLLTASFAFAQPISDHAQAQIAALLAEKDARTPAQRKIDSKLLYTAKMNRGEAIAAGIATLDTGLDPAVDVFPEVDIVARVSEPFLAKIRALGGEILDVQAALRSVRARLPLQSLEVLAAEPEVVFVNAKQEAIAWREAAPPAGPPKAVAAAVASDLRRRLPAGFDERAGRVRTRVTAALAARNSGGGRDLAKVDTSEGDVTHRAALARSTFGVAGAGVKIGVLSDGVNSLAARQASGDLPGVTVLPGQAGSGDEGTAMLEIVHDLAPGAQLYFATAFNGIASFAQNILDLRAAGCDIIVDDVFYYVETPFQKGQAPAVVSNTNGGLVIQSVNTVTSSGALYFSSAGNSGNLDSATAGVWEGDFVDGGAVGSPISAIEPGRLHLFGVQGYNVINFGSGPVNLYWSDPLGASANDYDLFRLDSTGAVVQDASTNVQSGTQDPYEQMTTTTGSRVVIVKFAGVGRYLHLNTNRGRLSIPTVGQTHGHSASPGLYAFGVAATPAVGPFPSPFGPANVIETFSSDGPRRYFFNADSTAITPGNVSSTGGELQNKPDLTAADGVSTSTPGFNPFYGTSAAAPHAAAIAGLVKSAAPFASQAQLRTFLLTGAIDIMAAGIDRDSGVGILDAFSAVQATGVTPAAGLILGDVTVAEASGNGNAQLEPGECGALTVQLQNVSATLAATAVSASLTTSTPGVTITQGTVPYPDIAGGATVSNATPFRFVLSTSVSCPLVVNFTLTVTYLGGRSPQVLSFAVRTGKPAVVVATTLDGTAPPANPAYTAATGAQTGRINRFSPASSCGVAKANPGLFSASGARMYDAYTFTNCGSGPACIRIQVDYPNFANPASSMLFVAAYAGSFDPANPATNWLGDSASSSASMAFSVDVSAGQTFVVVVHEVNPGASATYPYTLTVDGACLPCSSYSTTYGCCPSGALAMSAPPAVGASSPNRTASVPATPGATYAWGITNGTITGGQGTSQLTFTAGAAGTVDLTVQETGPTGCIRNANANVPILAGGSAILFYTVPPCRVLDTRNPAGTYGGPALQPSATRSWALASQCGIPTDARAVSANITVVSPALPGFLTLFPGGTTKPVASSINFSTGQTRANNVILPLSTDGTGTFNAFTGSTGTVHFIFDVNGFVR
jgi:hypothetical protein